MVMRSDVIRIGFPSGLPADDLAFSYNQPDGSPAIVVWVPKSRRHTLGAAGREIKTAWNARAKRSGASPQGAA